MSTPPQAPDRPARVWALVVTRLRRAVAAPITPGAKRASLTLLVISLALAGANLLFTARYVDATQAAQRRAGQLVEQKLCSTFGALAALRPPPGDPQANPSRAYLQAEHTTLVQLGADLGCGGTR